MPFSDLREYIEALEREGELVRIKREVDWNLELGAVIRRSYDLRAPAPLFENVKDYPKGYRILGAPIGLSRRPRRALARLATALGLPPNSTFSEIVEWCAGRRKERIKPVVRDGGPCKEEVHLGDRVNLLDLPVPFFHKGDGGRYLGTWHIVVTKDPDTQWVNWGMYRLMVIDERTMGCLLRPDQHIGLHYYQKCEARGRPMEFAVAIGTEPVSSLVGAMRVPPGVEEADVAGGIRGEPVELVECETVDLCVPATAEIVIEGVVPPHEREEEGPFGEYTGYLAHESSPKPVFRVTALTHRRDPIQVHSCMGVPVDDSDVVTTVMRAADILDDLREKGFPVRMVYLPPEAVGHLAVISTRVPFANFAKHLAFSVWGSTSGRTIWYLVVVDEDIDPTDMGEVTWALTTRCHPQRGIFSTGSSWGIPLLPFLSEYEKTHYMGSQVLFDCTWPKDWPEQAVPVKASFDQVWPEEIQQRVLENWSAYGYAAENEED
ncbi:MAG: UbiD family decarboxylase [Deltaproteobacteria bacterium]|nr:UbiD family decarboxylase [Deltaproteobacteria bacterium]